MNDTVLFVDDEPNVLSSIRRTLHRKFKLDTAESGAQALRMMTANGGYAVIVSDMRMPGMSGLEFLLEAKKLAPDSVRLMLTGNADQQTAVEAVNVGDVFRFLNKPCQSDKLETAVGDSLRQYQLVTAEKELLEKTLRGSIKAVSDILALSKPEIFGRALRLKTHVTRMARQLKLDDVWKYESAALLSQIGCMAISEDLVQKRVHGTQLDDEEMAAFSDHARIGAELIRSIPRLESIAEMIRYQEKKFDGSGFPDDSVKSDEVPFGARLLKVVSDYDIATVGGCEDIEPMSVLKANAAWYDPDMLSAFEQSLALDDKLSLATVDVGKLADFMVLAADVRTAAGALLVAKGQETTLSVRSRLQVFLENGAIPKEVEVWTRPA